MEYEYAYQVLNFIETYGLGVDNFMNAMNEIICKDAPSGKKPLIPKELKCITYNILRYNNMKNLEQIAKILKEENADIIALQEVPEQFYYYLASDGYFTLNYSFNRPETFDLEYPDGEMLLIKTKLKPEFYEPQMLPETTQHRYLISAKINVNGKSFMIGTAHFESVFFTYNSEDIKCNQIGESAYVLLDERTDGIILMGDSNLTGAEFLHFDNSCIERSGLIDVLSYINPNLLEDQNDPAFRSKYITWDSQNNTLIRLNNKKKYFHRPDRCFFSGNLKPISIDRIVNSYSDHYGLIVKFIY
jgi:hypothetical protein